MKKQIFAAVALAGLAAGVAFAGATPGTGIVGSPHDMNSLSYTQKDDQGRVCAFCHTPHHALDSNDSVATYLPLWSHTPNNNLNFTAYGDGSSNVPFSSTLSATLATGDVLAGPSRLCMSCHDGVIAVDQHYGNLYAGTAPLTNMDGFGQAGIAAKDSLSNDHPIGFMYDDVAGAAVKDVPGGALGADPYINPSSTIYGETTNHKHPADLKISDRLNAGMMTCATCHDVHNRKNMQNIAKPAVNKFVLAPQDDSALCRTCHIK